METTEAIKTELEKLFHSHIMFKSKGAPLQKIIVVNYYLSSLRMIKFGLNTFSLGGRETFFIDNLQVPDNEYETFIISHKVVWGPSHFRFFVFSKTLLFWLVVAVDHIHIDSTNKLIYQGFPVLTISRTDLTRSYLRCSSVY